MELGRSCSARRVALVGRLGARLTTVNQEELAQLKPALSWSYWATGTRRRENQSRCVMRSPNAISTVLYSKHNPWGR